MRRVSLALALAGAVTAVGCSGGSAPSSPGGARGVAEGTFTVTIQNGQSIGGLAANPSLQISGGYVLSTPDGIDCGGAARTQCSFDFPAGTAVTLTANADAGQILLGWAGDCAGLNTTCTLTGLADKYVVVDFGTLAERSYHPNWSNPRLHGAEVGAGNFVCSQCHGQNLQGMGIAPSCGLCHDPAFVAAAKEVNEANPLVKVEKCASCHQTGSFAASEKHAISGVVTASATTPTVVGSDLQFTVNVQVDGVANDNMLVNTPTVYRFEEAAGTPAATVIANFVRTSLAATTGYTIASAGNGDYTVTIVGGASLTGNRTFAVRLGDQLEDPVTETFPANTNWATVLTHLNAPARDLVGNQACVNCHGAQVFRHREENGEWHHGANPYGVQACVVCHTRSSSISRAMGGDRTMAYVHGVHNSHEMPPRDITRNLDPDGTGPLPSQPFTVTKPDGVYARNDSLRMVSGSTTVAEISSPWSIGFPGYMVNCSACHDTQARLDAIMAKPITHSTCFSCHDSMNGFPVFVVGNARHTARLSADASWETAVAAPHRAMPQPVAGTATASACAGCHDGVQQYTPASGPARAIFSTVGEVHNVRYTARNGLVYDGRDQSIAEGEKIVMTVTGVTVVAGPPAQYQITWTATRNGVAVDPCNATVSTTAPVFIGATTNAATGQANSNMSVLLSYAQGDDWVNGVGTSPGQPASATNLTTTNTVCASNVATSTVNVPAGVPAFATKAQAGLQGKPQITFAGTNVNPGQANPDERVIQVRSESPVYAFNLSTGAAATPRRAVVSNDKCLACHAGSLYQHGGNRIDSVQLCVMCHAPAASEKNVRVGMGVDATEAYDGKVGQTYDLRYMLHAIHSAGETNALLVYYRTNGVYAFGSQAAIDAIPNWPGAGSFKPFGSGANEPNRTHNEIVVHYPRALNDCDACHVNDSQYGFLPQSVAMAVTVHDSGATQAFNEAVPVYTGAANANLADDVLMGAQAASCMSCHQSGVPATQAALRGHAYDFGWTPSAFTLGRETLVNFAVCGAETCP